MTLAHPCNSTNASVNNKENTNNSRRAKPVPSALQQLSNRFSIGRIMSLRGALAAGLKLAAHSRPVPVSGSTLNKTNYCNFCVMGDHNREE